MASKRFGMVLKRLREARGLTQQALADKAKVTDAYIAMLETGVRTNPTIDTLKRLAKALKVTVGELAQSVGRKGPASCTRITGMQSTRGTASMSCDSATRRGPHRSCDSPCSSRTIAPPREMSWTASGANTSLGIRRS